MNSVETPHAAPSRVTRRRGRDVRFVGKLPLPPPRQVGRARAKLRMYGIVLLVLRRKLGGFWRRLSGPSAAHAVDAGEHARDPAGPLIVVSAKTSSTIKALIKTSHDRPMDLNTSLPWHLGADRRLPAKELDQIWVAGTPYESMLTDAQRIETSWLEIARDVSMFIHFELQLPRLYMGYVNEYEGRLPPEVTEYLMIFSKEEIVHSLAFQRYLEIAGLPFYQLSKKRTALIAKLRHLHPCAGILATLVIEWGAELVAMHCTQAEGIDPLTRELFKQHHQDEIRHIAFARRLVEEYVASESEANLRPVRQMLRDVLIPITMEETSFNADIAKYTSFRFPVQAGDHAAIESIRFSDSTLRLNEMRYFELYDWYRKLGLM